MNLADIMDALAVRLATVPGMAGATPYPVDNVPTTPWAAVSYGGEGTFDATYQRGHDDMSLPVVIVVGRPKDARGVRDLLTGFTAGDGDSSVKAILEAEPLPDGIDALRVTTWEVERITIGGQDYIAAVFDVEIDG